jgi:outer membrane autotransporter protein
MPAPAAPASGDVRTVFFGLYGSWTMGPLYVDAAASYGHGQFSTTRTAALGDIEERATGSYDGNQYGGRIEAGWRFMINRTELTPFAGVGVQSLSQGAYTESSQTTAAVPAPGILGLSYQSQTTTSVRSFVGGQVATGWRLGETTTLGARLRAAWAHEFNADRALNASFVTIPGALFTVNGARPARDAALVTAGLDLNLGRNATLYAQFDGDLAGSGNAYAGSAGLRIHW